MYYVKNLLWLLLLHYQHFLVLYFVDLLVIYIFPQVFYKKVVGGGVVEGVERKGGKKERKKEEESQLTEFPKERREETIFKKIETHF